MNDKPTPHVPWKLLGPVCAVFAVAITLVIRLVNSGLAYWLSGTVVFTLFFAALWLMGRRAVRDADDGKHPG